MKLKLKYKRESNKTPNYKLLNPIDKIENKPKTPEIEDAKDKHTSIYYRFNGENLIIINTEYGELRLNKIK